MRLKAISLSFVLAACGGSQATQSTRSPVAPADRGDVEPEDDDAPLGTVSRAGVDRAVQDGLGAMLQHVEFEAEPVKRKGKFVGFKIAALHDEDFWRGVDVRPGDVVCRINGMSIERPEEAQAAFRALRVASEIRVDLERADKPHVVRLAIEE